MEEEDRVDLALTAAELYYEQGLSQKQISHQMSISLTSVSRLLAYAREIELVRVTICRPENRRLSGSLHEHFPELRHVIVCGHGQIEVARAAVRFLERLESVPETIVVDGGLTIAECASMHVSHWVGKTSIVPIVADPPSYDKSAYENAICLARRCHSAHVIPIPQFRGPYLDSEIANCQEIARQAKVVLVSTGPFEFGYTAREFTKHLGLDPELIQRDYPEAVAAFGYIALDESSEIVRIAEIEERLVRALTLLDLRRLAASTCIVMLVAHSGEKSKAVEVVIRSGAVNTLVVDESLAVRLVDKGR